MRFGKLPHPALGGVGWRRSEDAALLLASGSDGRQCELNCERSQDVLTCQEHQNASCVHGSQPLGVDSVNVGQEDIMVVLGEQPLLGKRLHPHQRQDSIQKSVSFPKQELVYTITLICFTRSKYLLDCQTLEPFFDVLGRDGRHGVTELSGVQSASDWKLLEVENGKLVTAQFIKTIHITFFKNPSRPSKVTIEDIILLSHISNLASPIYCHMH